MALNLERNSLIEKKRATGYICNMYIYDKAIKFFRVMLMKFV